MGACSIGGLEAERGVAVPAVEGSRCQAWNKESHDFCRGSVNKPVESSPSRTAVGYFLLGMYEALVAWGISYVICFCSVAGEQEGCLEFVSKYIPIAAITKGSVISGTILGLVTAFALFISIPIIIIFGIIASATTLIMLPITIVLLGVLVALFYLVKLIYLAITSCDRLILAVCL